MAPARACMLLLLLTATLLSTLQVTAEPSVQDDDWASLDAPVTPKTTAPPTPASSSQPDSISQAIDDVKSFFYSVRSLFLGVGAQRAVFASEPKEKGALDKSLPWVMVAFVAVSLVATLVGGRSNAKRSLAWEEEFCKEGAILQKSFTRLGKGNAQLGKLMKQETSSSFKLYGTGHKHVEGMVATLTLLRRHEAVSYIGQLVTKHEDILCMELYLKEASMPNMVLAIATPATAKELLRRHTDLREFTQQTEVNKDRIKEWPSDELEVYAEHPSLFYDMMSKPMISQVFGASAFPAQQRYFRALLVSSENPGSHKKVIRAYYALPPAERMSELTTLMTAAMALADQVGSYTLTPEQQKRSDQARQEFEAQKEKALSKRQRQDLAFAREGGDSRKGKAKKR